MRLFVAIALDEAARTAIAREQERIAAEIRARGSRMPRPVDARHMPLTLAFIGEVPEPRADAIAAACAGTLDHAPFAVAFGGVGAFPPRGAPRVLWLGVTDGAAELVALQKILASRLDAL